MRKRNWRQWMAGTLALAMLVTGNPVVQASELQEAADSVQIETAETVETVETVETEEAIEVAETVETEEAVEIVEAAEPAESAETVETAEEIDAVAEVSGGKVSPGTFVVVEGGADAAFSVTVEAGQWYRLEFSNAHYCGWSIQDGQSESLRGVEGLYQATDDTINVSITNYENEAMSAALLKLDVLPGDTIRYNPNEQMGYKIPDSWRGNYSFMSEKTGFRVICSNGEYFNGQRFFTTSGEYAVVNLEEGLEYFITAGGDYEYLTEDLLTIRPVADITLYTNDKEYVWSDFPFYLQVPAEFVVMLSDGTSFVAREDAAKVVFKDSEGKEVENLSNPADGIYTVEYTLGDYQFRKTVEVLPAKQLPQIVMGKTYRVVSANGWNSSYYKYTAEKDTALTVIRGGSSAFCNYYNEDLEAINQDGWFLPFVDVKAGETIYLEFSNRAWEECFFTLSEVEKIADGEYAEFDCTTDNYAQCVFQTSEAGIYEVQLTWDAAKNSYMNIEHRFDGCFGSRSPSGQGTFSFEINLPANNKGSFLFSLPQNDGKIGIKVKKLPKIIGMEPTGYSNQVYYAGLHNLDFSSTGGGDYFNIYYADGTKKEKTYVYAYQFENYGVTVATKDKNGNVVTEYKDENGALIPGTYIREYNADGNIYTRTFEVVEPETIKVEDLMEINANENKAYKFIAPRDMNIKFRLMSGFYNWVYLYSDNGKNAQYFGGSIVSLQEGKTYIVYVNRENISNACTAKLIEIKTITDVKATFEGELYGYFSAGSIYSRMQDMKLELETSDGETIQTNLYDSYYNGPYYFDIQVYDENQNRYNMYDNLKPGNYTVVLTYRYDTSVIANVKVTVKDGSDFEELQIGKTYTIEKGDYYNGKYFKMTIPKTGTYNLDKYSSLSAYYLPCDATDDNRRYWDGCVRLTAGEYYVAFYAYNEPQKVTVTEVPEVASAKLLNEEKAVIDYGTWGYTFYTTSSNNTFKYAKTTAVTANTVINDMPTYVSGNTYVSSNELGHYSLLKPEVSYLWNFEIKGKDGSTLETMFNSAIWRAYNFIQKIFKADGTAAKTDGSGYLAPGDYYVKMENETASVSVPFTVVLQKGQIAISEQPESKRVDAEATVQFAVKAQGDKLTYQWQKSTDGGRTWVNSSSTGAKTNTLTMTAKSNYDGYKFRCKITEATGKAVYTNVVTLKVIGAPTITKQPAAVSVAVGQSAAFTVTATGNGLTYQWQKSTDGGKTWVNSASDGAKTNKLVMTTKTSFDGLQFRCKVTNEYGKTTISSAAKLTVSPLAITTQPASQTVTAGANAIFKMAATGSSLKYQWQKSTDGKTWANSSMTGATTNTLTVATKASYNGLQFRCKVTSGTAVLYTNAATLTVKEAVAITTQPTAQSVTAGANATFKVAATGSSLKYQWQKSTDGKTWANSSMTGATTNTLTVATKASYNGLQFRCKVTSGTTVLYTNAATLTVKAALTITTQPTAQTVTAGANATFKVAATGSSLKYQWQKSSDGGTTWANSSMTGATTNTLTVATKASYNGLQFRCKITDGTTTKYTNAVTLTVKAALTITTQPTAQTVTAGANATFKVAATGSSLKYQWQKSSDGGTTWANSSMTGATTNTLTVATKASYNGLQFRCKISDGTTTKYTNAVTLTVK